MATFDKLSVIYPLIKLNKDETLDKLIKNNDCEPIYSIYIKQPLFNYGFYHYIHQSKDKMIIFNTDKFKGKELIVNSYEHQVENFENDIKNTSEKYFSLPKNGIISRAFYKLWEILMTFDLLPHKGSINCVHLAEAPGGFIQATALYRKKFYTDSDIKKDTFTSISKKTCGKTKKKNEFILYKDDKFKNLANIQIYEEEDCDLMKNKIQKNLFKSTGEADFITADGGFEWQNENYQEQESYPLVLAEIICALRIQKKGGNFVIKIFETLTDITVKCHPGSVGHYYCRTLI